MSMDEARYGRKAYPVGDATHLANVLRALRTERGYTQTALGEALGVTKSRVSAIETDPGVVSINQLVTILARLGARLVIEVDAPKPSSVAERVRGGGEW